MQTHLITGAGSGIGAVLARRLHDRGDHLVLVARDPDRAADLRGSFPGAAVVVADLTDAGEVDALELPDGLDSVMHVAGVVELLPVSQLVVEDVCDQLEVNLVSPMVLTRRALPAVRRARGLVLFVNSSAGLVANASWSVYAASKFGLRGFADALRAEEVEHGVRVTTVFPSRTATPMQEKVHEQEGKVYDAARWISPETVVETMLHVLDLPPDATIPEVTVRPVVPRT